jgi:hypothetical protein
MRRTSQRGPWVGQETVRGRPRRSDPVPHFVRRIDRSAAWARTPPLEKLLPVNALISADGGLRADFRRLGDCARKVALTSSRRADATLVENWQCWRSLRESVPDNLIYRRLSSLPVEVGRLLSDMDCFRSQTIREPIRMSGFSQANPLSSLPRCGPPGRFTGAKGIYRQVSG